MKRGSGDVPAGGESSPTASRRGLVLDRVVLLGRTFDEYCRYFGLDEAVLRSGAILDVASGVSSFCAEANRMGFKVTAVDPIYDCAPEAIAPRCEVDLEAVVQGIGRASTYRWDFYGSPEGMRVYRERAWRTFLADFPAGHGSRYLAASLPQLPFADGQFELTLVSYLLLVYEHQLDYRFHRDSVRELIRVTRGEVRLYPVVTFEAEPSRHLARMREDPDLSDLEFQLVRTEFEFLVGSNWYLSVRRRPAAVGTPPVSRD